MNQVRAKNLAIYFTVISAVLLLTVPHEVFARVGGGQSYGGGSGGGSGGGGAGLGWVIIQLVRLLIYLTVEYPVIGIPIDIIVICGVVYYFAPRRNAKKSAVLFSSVMSAPPATGGESNSPRVAQDFSQLRKFDPNFSEIVFTDFCYALYGKAHEARGRGSAALNLFSPYLSSNARASLLQRNPTGLERVEVIIVGTMQVSRVHGLDTPLVSVTLNFESNYTEVEKTNGSTRQSAYYVRERWQLERKRDLLSPPPGQATALHCPQCGAPLQPDSVGACSFCLTKIDSGEFQWYVRDVALVSSEAKGPLLTSDVPEVGTDFPSVLQPNLSVVRAEFEKNNPTFTWGEFQARARLIFDELQAAWSSLNWERARPHETDNIFQMHQYWIDAYKRQGLRNIVDQCVVTAIQPVKIQEDAFYNAITLRIWAQGYDYTVDGKGKVVSGSQNNLRSWTEYWTFIRNRKARPIGAKADLNCPNCGGPLKVNASGVCEFCGGKITSGEFDWVLSKIEQDDSYAG